MEKVGWAGERGRRKGVERDERRSMVGTPEKMKLNEMRLV